MIVGFTQSPNARGAPPADPPGLTLIKNVDTVGLVRLYRFNNSNERPNPLDAAAVATLSSGEPAILHIHHCESWSSEKQHKHESWAYVSSAGLWNPCPLPIAPLRTLRNWQRSCRYDEASTAIYMSTEAAELPLLAT